MVRTLGGMMSPRPTCISRARLFLKSKFISVSGRSCSDVFMDEMRDSIWLYFPSYLSFLNSLGVVF